MKRSTLTYLSILLSTILLSACHKAERIRPVFPLIDSLSEINPDRAATLFSQLSSEQGSFTKEEKAFYTLLQTKIDIAQNKEIASDSAINSAIDYYEKNNDNCQLAYAYYYKAQINYSSRTDSLAILYVLKAIDKASMNNDLELSIDANNLLGTIYLFQNLPEYAWEAFKKAYTFAVNIPGKPQYQSLITRNIARAYNLKKMLSTNDEKQQYMDTSIIYYNKALDMLPDRIPNPLATSIFRELCTIYLFREDYPKAFNYLEAGKDTMEMVHYYNQKGNLFMNMEQYDSAYFYFQKCLSDTDPEHPIDYSIYDNLYRIERFRNNPQSALLYVDTLLTLSDKMISRTIPNKIVDIQKKYNEEKLRSEKASLEVKYQKEKTHSLRISFIIVILIFLSTYIYIYSYIKKKKLQQSLLKHKNELLVLNQKIQQSNQQMEHHQKKIRRLEEEKRQVESNLDILAKEKEIILQEKDEELEHCRIKESEIAIERGKYEDLCFMEFRKLFLLSPLASKIPAFGADKVITDKLSVRQQEQLIDIMDEVCFNFAYRLRTLLQISTEKTSLCCLIKLQVKPKYIMILCNLSKEAYYKQCQRLAENSLGKSSASALKDFISTF